MELLVKPGQPLVGSASELQQEAVDRLLATSTNPPSGSQGGGLVPAAHEALSTPQVVITT